MHLISQKAFSPLSCCVAIRHPGQVPESGTRAGIQNESDYIELSLDTGSRLRLVRYDDLSSLYIFSKICTNAPGLVAATPQALPTGERPFSQ